ncbi:GNAT family acetyltransferase [Nesterenkonia sp. MY13]|uniref:GNAT family acetyltransferase n=1 Tax=Nesterenkonia sedimenti TaxID=1463632 RepID=A0A7X8YER9_9MICC|nr:GNAT family acetyltransferase [Nesterenkonia sedimenti]
MLSASAANEAVALWEQAGLTRPWNDPHADFRRALESPAAEVLGIHDDAGALAATVMVGVDGHRGWIYYLAAAEEHRGQGLGQRLISAAEDWVRSQGIAKLMLMVRTENSGLAEYYEQLGYQRQETTVYGRRLIQDSPST